MYNRLDENRKRIADDFIEQINTNSGSNLTNSIITLIDNLNDGFIIGNEEPVEINLDSKEQEELLEAIYQNIEKEEDKRIFINEIIDNEKKIDSKIIDNFKEKSLAFYERDINETDESETQDDIEEDKNKDNNPSTDTTEDTTEQEAEEELEEEELEEIQEGPAIIEYKKETEELKQELQELEEKLAKIELEETALGKDEENAEKIKSIEEIIEKLTEEQALYIRRKEKFIDENPDYLNNPDLKREYELHEELIKGLDNELNKAKEDIENLKNQDVDKLNVIEVWKFGKIYEPEIKKLEDTLQQLQSIQDKLYAERKGIPFEIYGMKTTLETLISKMKKDYVDKCGIRSDINLNAPENKILKENILESRKINANINEKITENYKDYIDEETKQPVTEEINKDDLQQQIEAKKTEVKNREENIALYYDALKDINNINKEIKSGKSIKDEEIKTKIDNVNQKIEKLPENLKQELKEKLNNILGLKIEDVKKNHKLRNKIIAGLAGLVVGAGTVALFPAAAGVITVGSALLNVGLKVTQKIMKKREAKLAKENEITGIEKPNEKQKGAVAKFKKFMLNEDYVKNVSWFLTGATIGSAVMGIVNSYTASDTVSNTTTQSATQTSAEPTTEMVADAQTTDPLSEIKIGENVDGFNVTQGHDSASWAVNNVNSETLIGEYVNDSSVFQRFATVNPDGSIGQIINTPGTSLTEVISNSGLSADQIAVDVGKDGVSQAWVNVSELLKGVGKKL